MNKSIAAFLLALLATHAQAQEIFEIPTQYMSVRQCPMPNTMLDTNGLTMNLDLNSYAKSLGKDSISWLGTFKVSITYIGVEYREATYPMFSSNNLGGTFCAPSATCATKPLTDYLRSYAEYGIGIQNPNRSIFFPARLNYTCAVLFTLANGDMLRGIINTNCSAPTIIPTAISVSKTTFMENNNCFNFTFSNQFNQDSVGAYYSLAVNPSVFNPKPIPGSVLSALSTFNTTLYRDGKLVSSAPTYNGMSYIYNAAMNFTAGGFGTSSWAICNTFAPPTWLSTVRMALVDANNVTIAVLAIAPKSLNPLNTLSNTLIQSTTASQSPLSLTLIIKTSQPFNFYDVWYLRIVFPPIYGAGMPITISCLSLLNNSVVQIPYVTPSSTFDVTMPAQYIDLKKGVQISIKGLFSPYPGSYPVTFQILNVNKFALIPVQAKTMVSI